MQNMTNNDEDYAYGNFVCRSNVKSISNSTKFRDNLNNVNA